MVLYQKLTGILIYYGKNYDTMEKLLSVVKLTRQFRHYLLGGEFTVRTDHHSLSWLVNFRQPEGQIARWLKELSQ